MCVCVCTQAGSMSAAMLSNFAWALAAAGVRPCGAWLSEFWMVRQDTHTHTLHTYTHRMTPTPTHTCPHATPDTHTPVHTCMTWTRVCSTPHRVRDLSRTCCIVGNTLVHGMSFTCPSTHACLLTGNATSVCSL